MQRPAKIGTIVGANKNVAVKVSERRAQSVKTWFVDKDGLTHVDFATRGLGMRDPVAPNTKPDGRRRRGRRGRW